MACVRRPRPARRAGARNGEIRAVMFADAEDVEPNLVGELDLLEQVAQPLRGADGPGGRARRRYSMLSSMLLQL